MRVSPLFFKCKSLMKCRRTGRDDLNKDDPSTCTQDQRKISCQHDFSPPYYCLFNVLTKLLFYFSIKINAAHWPGVNETCGRPFEIGGLFLMCRRRAFFLLYDFLAVIRPSWVKFRILTKSSVSDGLWPLKFFQFIYDVIVLWI